MNKIAPFVLLLTLIVGSHGLAKKSPAEVATPPYQKQTFKDYETYLMAQTPFATAAPKLTTMTDADLTKHLAEIRKTAEQSPKSQLRSLAQDSSAPLSTFVAQFNQVKNANDFEQRLEDLDKNYDTLDTNVKLAAILLTPLHEFRGFLWKMIPLFPSSRVFHSMALTTVERLVSLQRVYFPTQEWDAFVDYLSKPYLDGSGAFAQQFKTEAEFQVGIMNFYGALQKSYDRLVALDVSKPLLFDKQLAYGNASFKDSVDRYRYIGPAEKYFLLSMIQGTMAKMAAFRAYSVHDMMALYQEMGSLYGFDGFLFGNVKGASSELRMSVLRHHPTYDVLLPDGKNWMAESFAHLKSSYQHLQEFYAARGSQDSALFLIDTDLFRGSEREIGFALENMNHILAGPFSLQSPITGDSADVDLPRYYSDPPERMSDFFPIAWDKTGSDLKPYVLSPERGKRVSTYYREYASGRPVLWRGTVYKKYFPSIQLQPDGSTKDIGRVANVLMQSWGGGILGSPLTDFVQ